MEKIKFTIEFDAKYINNLIAISGGDVLSEEQMKESFPIKDATVSDISTAMDGDISEKDLGLMLASMVFALNIKNIEKELDKQLRHEKRELNN